MADTLKQEFFNIYNDNFILDIEILVDKNNKQTLLNKIECPDCLFPSCYLREPFYKLKDIIVGSTLFCPVCQFKKDVKKEVIKLTKRLII